ncbi:MAG: hypothetical protein NZU63_13265 [Gemmataceae bacterium]|nr:hypothetical protein [Gemmataceae bacterium]MDW8241631.1 hypothetical protein [Thermogemmata sp.]
MNSESIQIELEGQLPTQLPVGEPVPLRLVIRNRMDVPGAQPTILRGLASVDIGKKPSERRGIELEAEMFERGITLQPGDEYRCEVIARFTREGVLPPPHFVLSVGQEPYDRRIGLPTPTIEVIPALQRELRMVIEPICTYEQIGTKAVLRIKHIGTSHLHEMRLQIGPAEAVRVGLTTIYKPTFTPNEDLEIPLVVSQGVIEVRIEVQVEKRVLTPIIRQLVVPPVREETAIKLFRFLEPRKLSDAEVELRPFGEDSRPLKCRHGVYVVNGQGKYRLIIRPRHPQVRDVRVVSHRGVAEVDALPVRDGTWEFQVQLVSDPTLVNQSTLHYEVLTADGPQQGEVNLFIRPSSPRLWTTATACGAAVTFKGLLGLFLALREPEAIWQHLFLSGEFLYNNSLNLLALACIPAFWLGLWTTNRCLELTMD